MNIKRKNIMRRININIDVINLLIKIFFAFFTLHTRHILWSQTWLNMARNQVGRSSIINENEGKKKKKSTSSHVRSSTRNLLRMYTHVHTFIRI